MSSIDLAALGVQTQEEVEAGAWARILLLGPAKTGKSVSILKDAPKPFVINGDCEDSVLPAIRFRAQQNPAPDGKLMVKDVHNRQEWVDAQKVARKLVEADMARTIVVDTISMLALSIVNDAKLRGFEGFDLWNEVNDQLQGGYRRLAELPAHLVLIAHMDPQEDEISGIMPLIPGKSKTVLPALVNDWVLLDYNADTRKRSFLLGPQGKWTHSGRNVNRSCAIDASFTALLDELGIAV